MHAAQSETLLWSEAVRLSNRLMSARSRPSRCQRPSTGRSRLLLHRPGQLDGQSASQHVVSWSERACVVCLFRRQNDVRRKRNDLWTEIRRRGAAQQSDDGEKNWPRERRTEKK